MMLKFFIGRNANEIFFSNVVGKNYLKTINLEILLGRNYYGIIFCINLNIFKRKLIYIFSTLLYIFKTYLYIFSKLMYIFSTFWNEKKYNAEQYIYFLNHFRQSSTFCIQIFSYLQLYLYLHS